MLSLPQQFLKKYYLMTSTSSLKLQFSDEELDEFLNEIGVFSDTEEESNNPSGEIDRLFAQVFAEKEKTTSFRLAWVFIPFLFVLGFLAGWLMKPVHSPSRSIEVISEEIILLLEELKQNYQPFPSASLETPLSTSEKNILTNESEKMEVLPTTPDAEIIEPIAPLGDFSVA